MTYWKTCDNHQVNTDSCVGKTCSRFCVVLDLDSPIVLGLMVSLTPELAPLGPVARIHWIRNKGYRNAICRKFLSVTNFYGQSINYESF